MPHRMIPRRGCLVKTDEGYFGIVKTVYADTATVFLSNGLVVDLPKDALTGLPMQDFANEDACFVELVDAYETMERLRRAQQDAQASACPLIGRSN